MPPRQQGVTDSRVFEGIEKAPRDLFVLDSFADQSLPAQAPFERIIVTAAPKEPQPALLDQLAVGGIMVNPLDAGRGCQWLVRITRTARGFEREHMLDVRFVPLAKGLQRYETSIYSINRPLT
jgi:protein-L-isoaspartate O-methyltransferase